MHILLRNCLPLSLFVLDKKIYVYLLSICLIYLLYEYTFDLDFYQLVCYPKRHNCIHFIGVLKRFTKHLSQNQLENEYFL